VSDLLGEDAPSTSPVIQHRLVAVATVRGVLVVVVTIFLVTAGRNLVTSENVPLAVATVLGVLVFTAAVPLWPVAAHRAVLDVSIVVDAGAVAILLALTGGAASPFTPLVVVVAALPLIAFGARTGLRAAIATTVALGWVWATSPDVVATDGVAAVPRAALVADTRILVTLLATWAAVAAVALLTRVVEADLRRAASDKDTLHRIGRSLDPEDGTEGVAARLAASVVDHLDADAASVWLTDRTRTGLVLAAQTGAGARRLAERPELPRDGLVARALETDGVVLGRPIGPLVEAHGDAAIAVVALRGDAPAPHGILVLQLPHRRRRLGAELDVRQSQALEELANDAGAALDDAHAMDHLRTLARTDPVTGMPNHRVMQERLRIELNRLDRRRGRGQAAALSLALFDLDHFKRVNDTHGHPTGDAVLAAVAEAVDRAARAADVVCRYGGEEFAVVLADTNTDEAIAACERLRAVVAGVRVPAPDGTLVKVTASFGSATVLEPGVDRAALIAAADEALYEAKETGRNRVVARGVVSATAA
jgi:diguanylate cyclase (GGDEF)-like protein